MTLLPMGILWGEIFSALLPTKSQSSEGLENDCVQDGSEAGVEGAD